MDSPSEGRNEDDLEQVSRNFGEVGIIYHKRRYAGIFISSRRLFAFYRHLSYVSLRVVCQSKVSIS